MMLQLKLKQVNVLCISFDSKQSWSEPILKLINKTNSALHCIRQIKYYSELEEIRQKLCQITIQYSILIQWSGISLAWILSLDKNFYQPQQIHLRSAPQAIMTGCRTGNCIILITEQPQSKCVITNMRCTLWAKKCGITCEILDLP